MKPGLTYDFHHMGIPTDTPRPGEVFSPAAGMFTADNPGRFRIQWHRFLPDSPLHPLIRSVPHPAFKVADLEAAIAGYRVAIINDNGVPVELIRTDLDDAEIWARARSGQGSLYRDDRP